MCLPNSSFKMSSLAIGRRRRKTQIEEFFSGGSSGAGTAGTRGPDPQTPPAFLAFAVCVPQNVRLCYVDISRTSGNLVVICRRRELNI